MAFPTPALPILSNLPGPMVPKSMRVGLIERLFGGSDDLRGLMGAEAMGDAKRAGLLNAGLSLMAAGGRQPKVFRPNLGQALLGALQQGQGGYQAALEGAANVKNMRAQQQQAEMAERAAAQQAQAIAALDAEFAGKPQTKETMAQYLMRRSLIEGQPGAATNALQAMPTPEGPGKRELLRNDLGDRVQFIDPQTNEVVREDRKGATPGSGGGGSSFAQSMAMERFLAGRDDRISSGFDKEVAPAMEIINRYDTLAAAAKQFGANAPVQIGTLFTFITQLDDTAVKDGERQMAEQGARLSDRLRALQTTARDGQVVIPLGLQRDLFNYLKVGRQKAAERANAIRDKWNTRAMRSPGMVNPEELTALPSSVLWADVEGRERSPYD